MENAVERDPRDSSNRVSAGLALRGNRIPQGGLVHFVLMAPSSGQLAFEWPRSVRDRVVQHTMASDTAGV